MPFDTSCQHCNNSFFKYGNVDAAYNRYSFDDMSAQLDRDTAQSYDREYFSIDVQPEDGWTQRHPILTWMIFIGLLIAAIMATRDQERWRY
jgi:hypothetical protein